MNLNKSNWIQIICFLLSVDTVTHTHRWKFMQFVEQMWALLTWHLTALNQQLSCRQIYIQSTNDQKCYEVRVIEATPPPPPSCGRKNVHDLRKNKLHINIHYYILKTAYFTIHTDVNINLHEDKKKVCCRCFVKELTIIITLS